MTDKNVLIPLPLLDRIIDLLQYFNFSGHPELGSEYDDILWMLKMKKQKIKLRASYAKILAAESENQRDEARIDYLRARRELEGYVDF
jgi:hypothetical protein